MTVGGQAVIEGVMMRSPNSFAVCLRAADGKIVVREDRWQGVWTRAKFLRKPFLRGVVVLVEALWNGISSLTFSAKWAAMEEDKKSDDTLTAGDGSIKQASGLTDIALIVTMLVSFAFAMGLFVVLPHVLTALFGFSTDTVAFHAIDGVIKIAFLIAYVGLIGLAPDIRRVFQYHGAEHMAISTYEKNLPLTVEHARGFSTYHPRCGTSFLLFVLTVSIFVFSFVFPFLPELAGVPKILRNVLYIGIKIPLMLPVAGISYEIIRLAGKNENHPVLSLISKPGMWLQRLTTRRPTDDQLEVALVSLRTCLWREQVVRESNETEIPGRLSLYESFGEAAQTIA